MWRKRGVNKYGAVRTANGFPSKLEEAVWNVLLLREKAGEISNIQRQAKVLLTAAEIPWKVDFSFFDERIEATCYAEAKGIEDDRFKLFKKLWPHYGPGILEVWKGDYRRPKLVETISPITIPESLLDKLRKGL